MKTPKVDRAFFNAQVQRLSASDFFPTIKAGITELIDSLIRVSGEDLEHARRIIDRALKTPKCPTPADLEAIAENLPNAAPLGCEKCEGTGRVYVKRRVKDVITGDPIEVDCQKNCDCTLGQFLKAREKEAAMAGVRP
jgi:hypothetical protein